MEGSDNWKFLRMLNGNKSKGIKDAEHIENRMTSLSDDLMSIDDLKGSLKREFSKWNIYTHLEIEKGITSILESNLGHIGRQSLLEKHFSKDAVNNIENIKKYSEIPVYSMLILKVDDKYLFKTVYINSSKKDELEICLTILKIIEEIKLNFSDMVNCINEFENYRKSVEINYHGDEIKGYLEDRLSEIMKDEEKPYIVKYWLMMELRKALSNPEVDRNIMNLLKRDEDVFSNIWTEFLGESYVDRTFLYHPNYKVVIDTVTNLLYMNSFDEIDFSEDEYFEICYAMFTALYHMNKHDTALQFGEKLVASNFLKETNYGAGLIFVYRVRPYTNYETRRDFLYRKMIEMYVERGLYQKAKNLFFDKYKPYYSSLLKKEEFWNNLDLLFQYECQCFVKVNNPKVRGFRYSEKYFAKTLQCIETDNFDVENAWRPENLNTGEHADYKEVRVFIEKVILVLVNDNNFLNASNLLNVYSKYFDYSDIFVNQLSPAIEKRIHNEFESKLSKVWNSLYDSSRNNIRMAEFLYYEIKNNDNSMDYSAPALCLGKALEFELERRWALPVEKEALIKRIGLLNPRGFKKPSRTNERNVERMIKYNLGHYIHSYKSSENPNGEGFFENEVLSYYRDSKLTESKLESILGDNGLLKKISNYRNKAAHASNTITESNLIEMIDILIKGRDPLFISIIDGYQER